ncbi:MAG: hypothetical protein ACR2M1_13835 [Gemmatimonadaceae bacterium]
MARRALMIRMRSCRSVKIYQEGATTVRVAQEQISSFADGVIRIIEPARERVTEHGSRLIEADAMLAPISSCFRRIPLEAEVHAANLR